MSAKFFTTNKFYFPSKISFVSLGRSLSHCKCCLGYLNWQSCNKGSLVETDSYISNKEYTVSVELKIIKSTKIFILVVISMGPVILNNVSNKIAFLVKLVCPPPQPSLTLGLDMSL